MEDRIGKTVELEAPVARVWRALTDHKEFGEWFRVALEGPFVVGEVSRGQITYPGYESDCCSKPICPRDITFRNSMFGWTY